MARRYGFIDCYLAQSRHREAVSVATAACKCLNNSPRALTLYAQVLLKDPLQLSLQKAKSLLEKALVADPHHLPAVYLLAELLEQEMNLDQAIEWITDDELVEVTPKSIRIRKAVLDAEQRKQAQKRQVALAV